MSKNSTSKQFGTDIQALRQLIDADIDFSDIPTTTPKFWADAVIRKGLKPVTRKQQVTVRIDSDVLEYLRSEGSGYQTKINQLLRSYMDASKAAEAK